MVRSSGSHVSPAFAFVLTTGIVNLFGDITYEGGASINGPFMASLGASAAVVSITAGLGEFLGYALRLPAGYIADRSGHYWLITFIGYVINLFAVPAMALATNWQLAAALIIAERIGRALRKPTVEAMLSYTTGELGKGWVYALNTALDEIGATVGPLLIALVLLLKGDYRSGYALLLISALAALASLVVARVKFPLPSDLERGRTATANGLTTAYWLYMLAGALFAAGRADLVSSVASEGRIGAVDSGHARDFSSDRILRCCAALVRTGLHRSAAKAACLKPPKSTAPEHASSDAAYWNSSSIAGAARRPDVVRPQRQRPRPQRRRAVQPSRSRRPR